MIAFYGSYWCADCKRYTRWLFVADEPKSCTECRSAQGSGQESK